MGTFVGTANASRGSGAGTITIDGSGLGIADTDLLLTIIVGRRDVDPTTLSGWTLVGSRDTSDDPSQFLYLRTASGESGSYTWTLADGGTGALLVYRGVQFGAVGTWARVMNGALTIDEITMGGAGDILLAFYSQDANSITWTPPTGMSERVDVQGAANESQTLGVAELNPSGLGATGTKSPTPTSTATASAGVLVSLRAAGTNGLLMCGTF